MRFVRIITCLLFMCMFAAMQNLALIQALRSRHQGERGEQPGCTGLSSLWGMDILFRLFSTSHSLRLRPGVFMNCGE